MKGSEDGGGEDDASLCLDDLTVLLSVAQEDPFQDDVEADLEPEEVLPVGPEEWLED